MYDDFEGLRKKLLAQVVEQDEEELTEKFNREFLKLIQLSVASLMAGEDNFFALFMIQIERKIKFDLPVAMATVIKNTNFIMYFNPRIVLECTLKEIQALVKHEIYHIINHHYTRAKHIKNLYSPLVINVAMDISINQYIKNLPVWSEKLENVRMAYHVDLKEEQTMEEYARLIQEAIDKIKRENVNVIEEENSSGEKSERQYDSTKSHDLWDEFDGILNENDIRELIVKTVQNAVIRNVGKIPKPVEKFIDDINKKSEISWKDYLKKLIGIIPKGYKKTITRKDRRQPERLDLRGKLSNHAAEIVVAIDISGSVTDKEIEQIMTEIFCIVKNHPYEVTIIECDSQIRRVYKVKSVKDIKRKMNTKGSTSFSPVFQYMNNEKLRNCILIYFTDGAGERELICRPINYKTIWVLTGRGEQLSLRETYGIVKRLSNIEYEKPDVTYMKNEMKEYTAEWAGK